MNQKQKIITVPNLLSLFRILLIPLIVKLYCYDENYLGALLVLILSGITDIADGMIARKFNLISDLGKALDPIADKLTQMATLACLLQRFSGMWVPLVILVVKELLTGILSLVAVKKTGRVKGADWHGKISTTLLYGVMGVHMLWIRIPLGISSTLIALCVLVMIFSGLLYVYRHIRQIRGYV